MQGLDHVQLVAMQGVLFSYDYLRYVRVYLVLVPQESWQLWIEALHESPMLLDRPCPITSWQNPNLLYS